MDLTTPLRADEVFTVQKHREVPISASAIISGDVPEKEVDGKKKKSSKKSKDVDSLKKPSKSKKSNEPDNDLLLMDWNDPPIPSVPKGYAMPSNPTEKKEKDKEPKSKSSSKKSSGSHVWLPLISDKHVNVFYSTSVAAQVVTITLKAVNIAKNGPNVSVTATFHSTSVVRPTTPSNSNLRVAHLLAPGGDSTAATELTLLSDTSNPSNMQIGCTAHVTVESLLGPEIKATAAVVNLSVCSYFSPNKLDEQGFQTLIAKSSSRWASSSAKVPCSSGKPKSALKAVASFLRAHMVEDENSRAASLSAKSASGGSVCCLAKSSKDGLSVTVDIKCLCASKGESKSLADAISEALGDLSL